MADQVVTQDPTDNTDVGEESTSAAEDSTDSDDGGDDDGDSPVTFATKTEYVKHINDVVQKRLKRNNAKYAPIVAERDTLREKVAELTPAKQVADTASTQIEALKRQVDELTSYRKATERNELVRRVAKEHGLPDEFISRVKGEDEDSIAEDVQDLVNLIPKVDGKPKAPKSPKPDSKEGKGGKGSGASGGADDDAKVDTRKLAAEVGRYGHRPLFQS